MRYTNSYNMPRAFTDAIDNNTYDITKSNPKRISLTTLINPPRIRLLSVRHYQELCEDYSDNIWRVIGNSLHYILSKTKQDNRLIEEKLVEKIGDIEVVCKPDIFDNETGEVADWKICSLWAVKESKIEWEQQLNSYAWAITKLGFEVKKLSIHALLKDWRKAELKRYSDYPPIPFKSLNIPLWSFEKQEEFIKERVKLYVENHNVLDDDLPICSPNERWADTTSYAVYRNNNKTATRVLESLALAQKTIDLAMQQDSKSKYRIEERPGIDRRCTGYCPVNKYCKYWREKYGQ